MVRLAVAGGDRGLPEVLGRLGFRVYVGMFPLILTVLDRGSITSIKNC